MFSSYSCSDSFFFFFQAEDGIRDDLVTGVQTCALPISLTSLLAQDAVSWSDGGGQVQTNLKPIHGKLAVARFWLSVMRKNQRPLTETLAEINGSPAILFWEEGRLAVVISLTLSAVGIQEIYALLNPEKLAYLQKQLSSSRRRSSFES